MKRQWFACDLVEDRICRDERSCWLGTTGTRVPATGWHGPGWKALGCTLSLLSFSASAMTLGSGQVLSEGPSVGKVLHLHVCVREWQTPKWGWGRGHPSFLPMSPSKTHHGGPRTRSVKARATALCPEGRWRLTSGPGATWSMASMRATCMAHASTPSVVWLLPARCACWMSTPRYDPLLCACWPAGIPSQSSAPPSPRHLSRCGPSMCGWHPLPELYSPALPLPVSPGAALVCACWLAGWHPLLELCSPSPHCLPSTPLPPPAAANHTFSYLPNALFLWSPPVTPLPPASWLHPSVPCNLSQTSASVCHCCVLSRRL